MQTRELTELNYLLPSNPSPNNLANNYKMNPNNKSTFEFQKFFVYQNPSSLDFITSQSSCISNNSASDEADEQQLSLTYEKKHRRMMSNRESARRSRMRKQKHLDELWSQVLWLRNENHRLVDKLNHVSENHDQMVQENVQLKKEVSELRQMIRDMQIQSPHPCFSLFGDVPCNSAFLRPDSSKQSISSSMDLLSYFEDN